jgi:Zn-dependent protease
MFLQEPDQTQYDVRFRLFDIPVRIHPLFWLVSVFLGFSALQENPGLTGFFYLGLWVACVFVSILVHELGHVFVGKVFGCNGHIVLYSFGGLAIGSAGQSNRWQRIAVTFAGPGAGFVLLAGILFAGAFYDSNLMLRLLGGMFGLEWGGPVEQVPPRWLIILLIDMIAINLYWGLVNLLPIWPLDGGQISREVCTGYLANGMRTSLIISIVVSGAFVVYSLLTLVNKDWAISFLPPLGLFGLLFFGFLAYGSWLMLQQVPRGGGQYRMDEESYERAPWERDADWWKR